MDTLVALGTLVAYVYSVFALLLVSQYTLRLRVLSSSLSLLGQIFEERMRNNASEAVEKLLDLQAKTAQVLRDGNYVEVAAEDIQIDDLIPGPSWEKIAVDGTIVEGSTTIDESMVTGESLPVENQLVMQLSAPLSTAMGPFSLRLKKSVVRPSYLKLWTLSKWPNPVVLQFKI